MNDLTDPALGTQPVMLDHLEELILRLWRDNDALRAERDAALARESCTDCRTQSDDMSKERAITAWNTRTAAIPDPMSDPRVVALVSAAKETWEQACVNHDQPPPVKYMAPYGGLVKLHAALSAITKETPHER